MLCEGKHHHINLKRIYLLSINTCEICQKHFLIWVCRKKHILILSLPRKTSLFLFDVHGLLKTAICLGCLENWNFKNCPGLKFFFSLAVSSTSPTYSHPPSTHHQYYYYSYTHVVKCPRQTFDADSNVIKKSGSSSDIYAKKTTQQKKASGLLFSWFG